MRRSRHRRRRADRRPADRPRSRPIGRASGAAGTGRSSARPAGRGELVVDAGRQLRRAPRRPSHDAEPQGARPAVRRERPGATERDVDRAAVAAAARSTASTVGASWSSGVGPRKRSVRWSPSRRTQRTSRAPSGSGSARTASTSSSGRPRRRPRGAARRRTAAGPVMPANGSPAVGSGSALTRGPPASRSRGSSTLARATSPGRRAGPRGRGSWSRQPTTSTALSSSSL